MSKVKVVDINLLKNNYEIWGVFVKIQKLIARERDIELTRYGISPEQSHILHHLHDQGGSSTLNLIASFSLVSHNAASLMVRRMEKQGLVDRTKTQNSKQFRVSITQKGRDVFDKMPKISVEMTFSTLTLEEKRQFLICLKKLEERARKLLGMDYRPPF
jgi:DNA-binding MarR family transcriptional regulator